MYPLESIKGSGGDAGWKNGISNDHLQARQKGLYGLGGEAQMASNPAYPGTNRLNHSQQRGIDHGRLPNHHQQNKFKCAKLPLFSL
ncbi:MAG: hypothetical protein NG747_06705 [Candidatus Brocadia sp.]|nr:hypothetical protein [Candidatus Brocadia sp.]